MICCEFQPPILRGLQSMRLSRLQKPRNDSGRTRRGVKFSEVNIAVTVLKVLRFQGHHDFTSNYFAMLLLALFKCNLVEVTLRFTPLIFSPLKLWGAIRMTQLPRMRFCCFVKSCTKPTYSFHQVIVRNSTFFLQVLNLTRVSCFLPS